jgi:CheY-like chemotaxis protein
LNEIRKKSHNYNNILGQPKQKFILPRHTIRRKVVKPILLHSFLQTNLLVLLEQYHRTNVKFAINPRQVNKLAIIIDDDPISVLVCKTILLKYNFAENVRTFNCAEEGLAYLKTCIENGSEYPTYIFLDVVMPHMDGWAFMEKYQQVENIPAMKKHVVMLSATFDPDDRKRAERLPMVSQFLSKPITEEALNVLRAAQIARSNA